MDGLCGGRELESEDKSAGGWEARSRCALAPLAAGPAAFPRASVELRHGDCDRRLEPRASASPNTKRLHEPLTTFLFLRAAIALLHQLSSEQ